MFFPWANDTVSYSYDNRLRSSLGVIAPNSSAWVESYGYDAAKRLTNVTSVAGSFGYAYDPLRHLEVSRLSLPNGAFITNNFDSVARLLSTTLKSSQSAILNAHQYSYNLASQRTQQVFTATNYVNYTYDNMGQLLTALGKESGGVTNRLHEQLGYGYDAAGNLNFRTNNALRQVFTVNSLNELSNSSYSGTLTVEGTTTGRATNVAVNAANATLYSDYTFAVAGFTPANGSNVFTAIAKDSYGRVDTNVSTSYLPSPISYTYDANGNLVSDGSRCFAYDDENQLVCAWVTNVWRSDFAYDGKMRRRARFESAWNGSKWVTNTVVRYVYDGNVVIEERDGNNLPQITYTRGRDLGGTLQGAGGIGGLLARTSISLLLSPSSSASAHAFYHCDGNGNVACLINGSQAVVAKYQYDPYGNLLSQSGLLADANLYRFSSKELHTASGLVYYLYRFYDPNLQRWPNRDPGDEEGGLNLYEFAANAPINLLDPNGRKPFLFPIPEPPPVKLPPVRLPPGLGPVLGPIGIAYTCGWLGAKAIDLGSELIWPDNSTRSCSPKERKMCAAQCGGYKYIFMCTVTSQGTMICQCRTIPHPGDPKPKPPSWP